MNKYLAGIGPRIRQLREHLKMSRKEFGDLLGVKATRVQDVERERHRPSMEMLAAIQDLFVPNSAWLLEGQEPMFLPRNQVSEPTSEWVERARAVAQGPPRGETAPVLKRYAAAQKVVAEVLQEHALDVGPLLLEAMRMLACDGGKTEHLIMLVKGIQHDRHQAT